MKDLQCQIQRKQIASLKQLGNFYKKWIIYDIYILKQFVLAHSMQIKSTFIIYYYDKSDTLLSRTQESAPTSPTYRVCLCNLESECKALIDFRNIWYKVIGLEIARFQAVSIMQSSKKDDPSEADIDEIIDLY